MRSQSRIIFLVLASIFLLGVWGQYQLDATNLKENFWNAIYEVLMLYVFGGEWTVVDNLPWQVELARVLAPAATVTGIVLAASEDAWHSKVTPFFISHFYKDHIVIAGLGDKAWHFIQSCEGKYKIVVMEKADNLLVARTRGKGASVIIGDILADNGFKAVNLGRAKHLLTLTDNDGTNVEIALKARDFVRKAQPPNHQLRVHLHVDDIKMSSRLSNYPKFSEDYSVAEISFFSVYDLSARTLLKQYPPEIFAEVFGQKQVHIALYHFGRMAERVLVEATQTCHFVNGSRMRFTVFDPDAKRRKEELHTEHPHLAKLCDITFVSKDVQSQDFIDELPQEVLASITEHVICYPTDAENLSFALTLRELLLKQVGCNAPIMVRMLQSRGLSQLLESNTGGPEVPDGLFPFGMLDEVLGVDCVINEDFDQLARSLHYVYLQTQESDAKPSFHAALQAWNDLSEPARKQSRQEADHYLVKLRAMRCLISNTPDDTFQWEDEEVELQAMMEHNRWRTNKIFTGWQGGQKRIESAKINPLITAWENLSSEERGRNRDRIREVTDVLRVDLGDNVCRELIIGVTGHRSHRLNYDNEKLKGSIEKHLEEIKWSYPDRKLIVMSPLAEGSDRMVARIAMEKFGMALKVLLPLPYELYETDFETYESREEFKELVGKAEMGYYEMPMKFGNCEQLALGLDSDNNEWRNHQYALVGAYIASRSDILIAIYDENPELGTGGTGQVVRWRRENRVDSLYVNDSDFFLLPKMNDLHIISPDPVMEPPKKDLHMRIT